LSNTNKKAADQKGSRTEVEFRLLEILYSLKYYSKRWLRARVYAEVAGFLQSRDAVKSFQEFNRHLGKDGEGLHRLNERLLDEAAGLNDGKIGDIDIPHNDIYS
jgi:hypothetical protein